MLDYVKICLTERGQLYKPRATPTPEETRVKVHRKLGAAIFPAATANDAKTARGEVGLGFLA